MIPDRVGHVALAIVTIAAGQNHIEAQAEKIQVEEAQVEEAPAGATPGKK